MAIRSSEAARTDQADGQRRSPGRFTGGFRARLITPGTGSPMRWFFSGIWLVYLVAPVSKLFGHHHGALWIAGGLAITVAFCLIYLPILMYQDRWPRRAHGGLAAMVLLAGLACGVYGYQWTPLWIYVSAAAGMVLRVGPGRRGGGRVRPRRKRRLLHFLQLALPSRPRELLCRAVARPAEWPGHDGV